MTCIVALKHNNKIYMGGDSLGSAGYTKVVRSDTKVFIAGDMIFGFCGSYRMGQILQYVMAHPERPEGISDMAYLVAHWIPAVIETFAESGFRGDKDIHYDHDETRKGGTFLLGYRGTVYQIEDDFQVGIPTDQYDAVGCGSDLALGAIFAAKKAGVKDPTKIVTVALEAAEKFSGGVQRPFVLLSI